jgi:branched-chain amino acid transport system permease protein
MRHGGLLKRSFGEDIAVAGTPKVRIWILLAAAGLIAAPFILPSFDLARLNLIWLAVIGALALNLLTGFAGQVSIGQAAFLAIGAFSGVATNRAGLSMWVALPVAAVSAGSVGLLIGIPSLRFKGFYLVMTTLALHFIVIFAATKYQGLAGGQEGFALPPQWLGPIPLTGELPWYCLLGSVALLTLLFSNNLTRAKVGRAWIAIRDRDAAAAIIGVDVTRYRLLAYALTSSMIGVQGCLNAYYLGFVSVDAFTLNLAITYVAMIIIGGMGSISGSLFGAIFVTQLPFVLQGLVETVSSFGFTVPQLALGIFSLNSAVFGAIIIGFLVLEPGGLAAIVTRFRVRASLWPYRRALEVMTGA